MKEKIKYIKSELLSYSFYIKKLKKLQEDMEVIDYKLTGVSGIDYTKPINTKNSYSNVNFYELMLKQDEIRERMTVIKDNIKLINQLLESVDDEYREIIECIYIYRNCTYEKISERKFMSERSLKRNVDKQLKKFIIDKEI